MMARIALLSALLASTASASWLKSPLQDAMEQRQRQLQEEEVVIETTPCFCACTIDETVGDMDGIAMVAQTEELMEEGQSSFCASFDASIDLTTRGEAVCNDFCLYTDDDSAVLGDGTDGV